jgi:hypothetical protein
MLAPLLSSAYWRSPNTNLPLFAGFGTLKAILRSNVLSKLAQDAVHIRDLKISVQPMKL